MAAVMDDPGPFFHRILHPEDGNFRAMDSDLLGSQVIKFKYILNEFSFLFINSALFAAGIHHH